MNEWLDYIATRVCSCQGILNNCLKSKLGNIFLVLIAHGQTKHSVYYHFL